MRNGAIRGYSASEMTRREMIDLLTSEADSYDRETLVEFCKNALAAQYDNMTTAELRVAVRAALK